MRVKYPDIDSFIISLEWPRFYLCSITFSSYLILLVVWYWTRARHTNFELFNKAVLLSYLLVLFLDFLGSAILVFGYQSRYSSLIEDILSTIG